MTTSVDKGDNIIDSRDVISRIEELESDRESLSDAVDTAREALSEHQDKEPEEFDDEGERREEWEAWNETLADLKLALVEASQDVDEWDEGSDAEELKELKAFNEEGESATSDWTYGATCILDSHFEDYAQELVSEIGDMPKEIPSYLVIDWEATARNIQSDYTSIEFGEHTYYVR